MPSHLFLDDEPWVDWSWVSSHIPAILGDLGQHVEFTVISLAAGIVISLPLGIAAQRRPFLRLPLLGVFGTFYTIPSLAFFALMIPYTGIGDLTALIPLSLYNVLILLRNVLVGLDEVPADVLDAANGMGYRPFARLIRIELPLALPAMFAGLRVATVSTIGIITIASVIALGGLGELIYEGFIESFRTPLVIGMALSIALALVADFSLAGVKRLAVPWARSG